MKHTFTRFNRLFVLSIILCLAAGIPAQTDTLHLYYHNTATKPHDTTLAKMDKWIKSLNGKHQDLKVIGYYHKLEFKKFAQERVDEMFLVVNRKARSLFTITEMAAKKGKDYQRTTVDLIYTRTGSSGAAATTDKKEENKVDVKKDNKKEEAKKPEEDVKPNDSEQTGEKVVTEEKEEKKKAEKKVKPLDTERYTYDSVYINGKLKVTKKKKK